MMYRLFLHVSEALVYILSIMEVFTQLYKPVPLYLVKYLNVLLHASDIFCVMSPFSSLSFKYLNCGLMVLFACLQLFSYHTRFLLFTQPTVQMILSPNIKSVMLTSWVLYLQILFSLFCDGFHSAHYFSFGWFFLPCKDFFYLYYISHHYYPFI